MGETGKATSGQSIAIDSGNNVYVAGYTGGNITACNGVSGACGGGNSKGAQDYFILKYDSTGAWQWTKTLGEVGFWTSSTGIAIDSGNNAYIGGFTTGNIGACNGVSGVCGGGASAGVQDYFISKYNSAGAWQWTSTLGETSKSLQANGLAIDSANNVYITGFTSGDTKACNGVSGACGGGSSQGTTDYFFSKYNSAGVWQSTITLGETLTNSQAFALTLDSSKNVILVGQTNASLAACNGVSGACGGGSSHGSQDYFVSQYNSSGTWVWTQTLGEGGGKSTQANAVTTDTSGNIFVVGSTTADLASCNGVAGTCSGGSAQGAPDYFVSKYSSGGAWQWTKTLGETATTTSASTVVADSSGNVYVAGLTTASLAACNGVSGPCGGGTSQGSQDYFISKYDSTGTWQWTQTLGETGKTITNIVLSIDGSSNLYIGGYTNGKLSACAGVSGACGAGLSQGTTDYFISKYNSAGTWQWTKALGETGKTINTTGIAADSAGNVYIVGYTTGKIVNCAGVSGACGGGASQGFTDYFISKYNTAGTWQWTKALGETSMSTMGGYIAVESSGSNVYIAGYTSGNIAACNGVSGACGGGSAQGQYDLYISKYKANGTWQWTKTLGQTSMIAQVLSIGTDSSNNVLIVGYTGGNLAACNGVSGACGGGLSQGNHDMFIAKYNSAGNWQWLRSLGEAGLNVNVQGLSVDPAGNVEAVGSTNANLSGCNGVSALCSGKSTSPIDYFLLKYRRW